MALDEVPLLPQEAHRKDRIGCPETQTSDGVIRHPVSPRVMCSLGKAPTTLQLVHNTGSSPSEHVLEANHNAPAFLLLSALWFNLATAALEISIQEKVKKQGEGSKEMGGSVVYTGRYALRSHQKLLRCLPRLCSCSVCRRRRYHPPAWYTEVSSSPFNGWSCSTAASLEGWSTQAPNKTNAQSPSPVYSTLLLKIQVPASPEVSTSLNLVSKASRNELLTGPRPWDDSGWELWNTDSYDWSIYFTFSSKCHCELLSYWEF